MNHTDMICALINLSADSTDHVVNATNVADFILGLQQKHTDLELAYGQLRTEYLKFVEETEKKLKSLESGLEITLPHLTNRIINLEKPEFPTINNLVNEIARFRESHRNLEAQIAELRQQLEVRSKVQRCTGKLDCPCQHCAEHWSKTPLPRRPIIVTLCGSTSFSEAFQKANFDETIAGRAVFSIGCDTKSDDELFATMDDEALDQLKIDLDSLHLDKIDLSDEILVLNVGGYIGESTAREIRYAHAHGKAIRWLEPDKAIDAATATKTGTKPEPTHRTCMLCDNPTYAGFDLCEQHTIDAHRLVDTIQEQPDTYRSVLSDVQERIDTSIQYIEDENLRFELAGISEAVRKALEDDILTQLRQQSIANREDIWDSGWQAGYQSGMNDREISLQCTDYADLLVEMHHVLQVVRDSLIFVDADTRKSLNFEADLIKGIEQTLEKASPIVAELDTSGDPEPPDTPEVAEGVE